MYNLHVYVCMYVCMYVCYSTDTGETFLGLSMFGIVGALTVLILCLFSAAAVIARVGTVMLCMPARMYLLTYTRTYLLTYLPMALSQCLVCPKLI